MSSERPVVELDENHPLAVALRRQMKEDFISALSAQPSSSWQWKDAEVVLFGSTLMHQLHMADKVKLPLPGLRVSDIDIGVRMIKGANDEFYEKNCNTHLTQFLKKVVLDNNLDVGFEQGKNSGIFREVLGKSAIDALDLSLFSHDFHVTKVFNYDEVMAQIHTREDKGFLQTVIERDPHLWDAQHHKMKADVKIRLTISPNMPNERMSIQALTFLLNPDPLYPGPYHPKDGKVPLFREQALDMIAGKIVRAMKRGREFKPTDMLDLYNICNAHPPIIDLESTAPGSDLETLRALVVTYLADADVRAPYDKGRNLRVAFENSPENRQRFMAVASKEIATHRMPDEVTIGNMFKTADALVDKIFAKKPGKSAHGPLNYTDNDVRFAATVAGIDPETILNPPKPVKSSFLSRLSPRGVCTKTKEYVRPFEPTLRLDCLQAEYPQVFEMHPEISVHLKNSQTFQTLIAQAREQQMGKDRWGPE